MLINASQKLLVLAISSRALFDMDESNQIYETQGVAAYSQYQIENENNPLKPGAAFSLVKKLLALQDPHTQEALVEVILISRNSADTGLRIFNSIKEHKLPIIRAAFTSGGNTHTYINSFGVHLFLSTNPLDVRAVLKQGYAAATLLSSQHAYHASDHQELRIAFDGDAVLFSDESERIFQREGLPAFTQHEESKANIPLEAGPFKPFLAALHQIQTKFPKEICPIRTALVTARQAPAHERVIKTLRSWGIRIDEALFLGGKKKGEFLKAFAADIYFDDQQEHCKNTREHTATGHVPNNDL